MKVFISWSGLRSKTLANILHDRLPLILQNVTPYMSSEDIQTGTRWHTSISSELQSCNFGLFCLTPENLTAPWIHFEAGAISKVIDNSYVVPMLFDLKPSDIVGPLDQFHAAGFDRDGVHSVVKSINNAAGEKGLSERHLERAFTALWPQFDDAIKAIEPNIKVVDVSITLPPKGLELNYPLKCYVQLQNASTSCIDVRLSDYRPRDVTLKQFVSGVLQVKLGGWYPTPDGVDHVAVLPGQLFRVWVGLDENKFTQEQVKTLRGEIGTLVFSVNGDTLNVRI